MHPWASPSSRAPPVADADEVAELRDVLRGWSDVYTEPEHQQELSPHLGSPSLTKLHDRPKESRGGLKRRRNASKRPRAVMASLGVASCRGLAERTLVHRRSSVRRAYVQL